MLKKDSKCQVKLNVKVIYFIFVFAPEEFAHNVEQFFLGHHLSGKSSSAVD